ncbi:MAG: hypothetical protein V4858_01315 [Pseudomonadota bacterium]
MATILDPTVSALVGAAIGGVIGVVGTVITAWATSKREYRTFLRATSQQHNERVRSTYEFALNVVFNMSKRASPDRGTLGTTFSQVRLFGSAEVNELLGSYLDSPAQSTLDLSALVGAMKRHLLDLDKELS